MFSLEIFIGCDMLCRHRQRDLIIFQIAAVAVAVVLIAVVVTSFQDGRRRRDFGVRILNCSLSTDSRFLASGFF